LRSVEGKDFADPAIRKKFYDSYTSARQQKQRA
jgi:hypothetical protein